MKASRCVYLATGEQQFQVANEQLVVFEWTPGTSISSKKLNLVAFHRAIQGALPGFRHLEVSSYSGISEGVKLSAFNLALLDERGTRVAVEVAYQSAKRFLVSGSTIAIPAVTNSLEAKRESQHLSRIGDFVGFRYGGMDLGIEQSTLVFDLIYLDALRQNPVLLAKSVEFDVFSDFAFNKNKLGFVKGKSMATQARSLAGAVGAVRNGIQVEELIRIRMDTAKSANESNDRLF